MIGLWKVALRDALREALVVEGLRRVGELDRALPDCHGRLAAEPLDPFFNANTIEDLAEAERLRGGSEGQGILALLTRSAQEDLAVSRAQPRLL